MAPVVVDGETEAWVSSRTKKLLSEDIMNGLVAEGTNWETVYAMRP
jgi:hypothetical protein